MRSTIPMLLIAACLLLCGAPRLRAQWTQVGYLSEVSCFCPADSGLYAGSGTYGTFRSFNAGDSWFPWHTGLVNMNVSTMATYPWSSGGTLLLAGTGGGVYASTNSGNSWEIRSTGLNSTYSFLAFAISPDGGTIFTGSYLNGLFASTDEGLTWLPRNAGMNTEHWVVSAAVLQTGATTYTLLAAAAYEGIFRSTDAGASWSQYGSGLPDSTGYTGMAVGDDGNGGTVLYLSVWCHGLYRSTDLGASWTRVLDTPAAQYAMRPVTIPSAAGPARVVVATGDGVVYLSTDMGGQWADISAGVPTGTQVNGYQALARIGDYLYLGTYRHGVLRRAIAEVLPGGAPPEAPVPANPLGEAEVVSMGVSLAWAAVPGAQSYHLQVARDETFTDIVMDTSGITGLWDVTGVLEPMHTYAWRVRGVNTAGAGPWSVVRRFITSIPIGVSDVPAAPGAARLDANHPNPFGAGGTQMSVRLAAPARIALTVYDLLGRRVAVLADGAFPAGTHSFRFDAASLPAGHYLCVLRAGASVDVRRVTHY